LVVAAVVGAVVGPGQPAIEAVIDVIAMALAIATKTSLFICWVPFSVCRPG
jgi:hypothetical protein